jgi:hypothetical protein
MTKKDYEAIAEVINDSWLSHTGEEYRDMRTDAHNNAIEDLVMDLLPIFKADNERFNEGRFMEACGL